MKRLHALTAILFAGLLVFAGCPNPLEPPAAYKQQPAAGTGLFSLDIGGVSAGRTILPATVQNDFAQYDLVFSASGRTNITIERDREHLSETVELPAATWNLTVTAYLDNEKTSPAARGTLENITISSGATVNRSLELKAVVEAGATGTFKWTIDYPEEVTSASMTITPLDTATGTEEQTRYFVDAVAGAATTEKSGSATLNTGYYRVVFNLSNGTRQTGREEYLHIYKNLESAFAYTFTKVHFTVSWVTNNADTGAGSLRQAINDAAENSTIAIVSGVGTINLESGLTINKNLTIQGNGATITRAASWTTVDYYSQLLRITGGSVIISQVHFKDGRATYEGAAVFNGGNFTLESCVFSGNHVSLDDNRARGGAVYNTGTLTIKGSTFYGNSSESYGGAIFSFYGNLTLTGNLFYGNTARSAYPVVGWDGGTVTSGGYNVVDKAFGTDGDSRRSGFNAATGDTTVSVIPVTPVSFRPLSGRGAANVIPALPAGYPTVDFYGNAIPAANAAAGAVQSTASGYYLDLLVNYPGYGSVTASPSPDAEGLYSGAVTVTVTATAAEGRGLLYWLKDGVNAGSDNPLTLTLAAHTTVKAVFGRTITVDNFTDEAGDTTPGTLRYALLNSEYDDNIVLSGVTPGSTTIALTGRLPTVYGKVNIQGNGAVITPAASWTTWTDMNSFLLYVDGGDTVAVSRLHFKGAKGLAAVYNCGNLTLESCIFSGNVNHDNSDNTNGTVYNSDYGTLTVKGCTFYGNSTDDSSSYGAIFVRSGNLITLTGNLFYKNSTPDGRSVPMMWSGNLDKIRSGGYNVSDGYSFTNISVTEDRVISDIPISPVSFRPFAGSDAANVITALPAGYPTVDFYGSAIPAVNAAAGAVQGTATGYVLNHSVNYPAYGSVTVSPPNVDGLYPGAVTLTAAAVDSRELLYWLKDGVNIGSANPLTLTLTAHTTVQAVFGRTITVGNLTDEAGSDTTPGTLRYALTNAQDGDSIVLSGVTPGSTTITLTSTLPSINQNIAIQGNGAVITPASSWTVSNSSRLLYIPSGTVSISRIHFKDGRIDHGEGAAIYNNGNLTLESCVFSGNQIVAGLDSGGAVSTLGTLTVKGCTFYGNSSAQGPHGAINVRGTLTLAGNLFYGNTDTWNSPVGGFSGSTLISGGYNVSEEELPADYFSATGDTTFSALSISGDPINTSTFVPVAGLRSLVPSTVGAGFPATDFYGETRTWPGAPGAVK